MIPLALMALASAAAPAIGGLVGRAAGASDREKAEEARQRAVRGFDSITIPDYKSLAPEMLDESFLDKYNVDPRYKEAGLNALAKLQSMADSGGLDPEAQAELSAIQSKIATQERGNREAIIRQTQSGSGSRIAAQMSASQAAADRASQQGIDVAAMARRNALNSLMGGAQIANQMSNTEGAQMNAARQARANIKQFNNANTNRYKMDTPFQITNAQMGVANGRANALNGVANAADRSSDRAADMGSTIGQGVGTAIGYGAQAYNQSQQPKPMASSYKPDFSYGVQKEEDNDIPYYLRAQR